MRVLTPEQLATAARAAKSNVDFREGVVVDRFDFLGVAAAIEHEVDAMAGQPNQKITLHMDAPDAIEMARAFRRMALT